MSSTEEQKQERTHLAAVNEVIKTIASSIDLRQVYDTFARQLKKLIAFDRATVILIEGDKFKVFALSVDVESEFVPGMEMPLKGTAAEWIVANKKVHVTADLAEERQCWTDDVLFQEGMRSVIRIPLFSRGEVIGGFSLASREPNAFGEKEQQILEEVAPLLAVAIEKAKAEEGLRTERDKLHGILSSFADGVDIVSRDYRVQFQNKFLTDRFGDLTGRLCYEGYMARNEPCEFCPMVKAIANSRTESVELVTADGRNYELLATPFVDIDGETKAIEVFRDITERKQAEEALRESQEKLQRMFESVTEGIAVTDLNGVVIEVNERGLEMYGASSKDEVLGKSALELIAQRDHERATVNLRKTLERGAIRGIEYNLVKADGSEYPGELSVSVLRDGSGNPVGFISITKDITERKRAEEELRESEEKYRHLFQDLTDAAFLADVETGLILETNLQGEVLLGKRRHEIVGMHQRQLHPPDKADEYRRRFAEHIEKGHAVDYDGEVIKKDGTIVPVRISASTLTIRGQHLVLGLFRDITERKQAEEELKRHAKRQEALHAIAATVSQTLDLEQMLDSAVEKVREVMEADVATISVVDEEAGEITLKAHRGLSQEFVASVGRLSLDPDEVERIIEWQGPIIANEMIFSQRNLTRLAAAAEKEGLESTLGVQLSSKHFYVGSVTVGCRHPREFTNEDVDLLTAIANQIAVGIQNAHLFAEASHSATTDGLTGLYNHRYFQERLEGEMARVLRFGGECSLMMLDLDHFKIYNDLFGHVAGDEVLKRIGQVLRDYTRQVDIACRYGGEEFTVILPQTGPADTYQAAERLRQAIEQAFSQQGTSNGTHLTVSLGVASCPGDGISREALVHSADLAMREAKQRGRNQTCLASDVPSATPTEEVVGWEIAEHLEAASLNTIYALAAVVDARDHYTYGHSRSVAKYAVALGKALGLSRRTQERLRICGLLHDIGKIGLSDSIVRKSGSLDEAEWEMMRRHSALGATIISHTPELADCAPAIRHHHEWQDGSGYPDGLRGEDIPLGARIIAIVDAYDTMTTPRAYRQTLSPQEALEELRRCATTQFDPQLVESFAQVVNSSVVSIA